MRIFNNTPRSSQIIFSHNLRETSNFVVGVASWHLRFVIYGNNVWVLDFPPRIHFLQSYHTLLSLSQKLLEK